MSVREFQAFVMASISSSLVVVRTSETRRFLIVHGFAMGFRSGEPLDRPRWIFSHLIPYLLDWLVAVIYPLFNPSVCEILRDENDYSELSTETCLLTSLPVC
jgi:hypothetical protein